MISQVVKQTNIPLPVVSKGKVRDIYDIDNKLLIITTDRISAFDFVLPSPIPLKGICLNQLSKFWFDYTKDIVPNHLISTELDDFPEKLQGYSDHLKYRTMLAKKTQVIPIECIVRGYISGSAWKSYKKDETVCGIKLPSGLQESEQFDKPLFTPSTKAETGHDINISFDKMIELVGYSIAGQLREFS
ncbi:MAG: phosphoribosylaminoimidazolesuccinocarboxamide synthase, partial [Thermoplasmatales archaeon]